MNRRIAFCLFWVCLFVLGTVPTTSQSYYRLLFERGVFMVEAEANLEGAVPIFQEIVLRHPHDRPYAALSLFYLGICYKRMGSDSALQAFHDVITDYADQSSIVKMARTELTALIRSRPPISGSAQDPVPQLIWSGGGIFGSGSISRDGLSYVFLDRDTGELRLLDLESRKIRSLVGSEPMAGKEEGLAVLGRISPDSQWIAYGWHPREGGCELRILDLDEGRSRILLVDSEAMHLQPLDWTADGGQVLVGMIGSDLETRIISVNSRDGTPQILKEMGREWPAHMQLSPDGLYLAYGLLGEQDLPEHDLFLYSIPGKCEVPLVIQPGEEQLLGWTPGGGALLYLSRREATSRVFSLTIWEGQPRQPARLVHPGLNLNKPVGSTGDGRFFYLKTKGERSRQGSNEDGTELWAVADFFPEESRVLTVPDRFPTIQSAIRAANPGDTVYLSRGVYSENLTIDKPLILLGEERSSTIIDGEKRESVLHITSSSVTVQGVTITNGTIGVDIRSARPARFVVLKDCIVTKNTREGILTRNSGGNHTIQGCILSHNGAYAVNAHQFSNSIIRDCDVFENTAGLRVGWGWHITVEGNRVYRNGAPGIYPDSCYYSTIAGNLVLNNDEIGIKLGYISSRNIIRENIILGCVAGIWVGLEWGSYSRNRIYNNDLFQNRFQILEAREGLAGFQEWDNGPLSGGNFWSDYTGQDRDGDGIGDIPYAFTRGAYDQYPLMRPRNSALAILRIAPEQETPEGGDGWLEVHVALPAGLPLEDIKSASLRLNDVVSPDRRRSSIGDFDGDGVPEVRIRFRWRQVLASLQFGDGRTVSVSGELDSGLLFFGSAALDLSGR